jgi:uncharacterized protein YuzE
MKITYDKLAGALYFQILENTKIVESEEVKEGVILDLDINNQVVGIEILTVLNPNLENEIKNISIQISN